MADQTKQQLAELALEEGYSEEKIQSMIESVDLIFGDLL